MNIIIVGYGAMGKMVQEVCLSRKHSITAVIDPEYIKNNKNSDIKPQITKELAEIADCAIEFSWPGSVYNNAVNYCKLGLNAVMGTTGWYDKIDDIRKQVSESDIGFIYGPNFSIGAHLMFKIVANTTRLANKVPDYDILGFELHHKNKKDSPSGTAGRIGSIILDNSSTKDSIVTEKLDRTMKPNELHFASVRGGSIPGIHKVIFDSEADSIEISHTARSRKGFALGAVLAAEWLNNKSGFYKVQDFIDELLID